MNKTYNQVEQKSTLPHFGPPLSTRLLQHTIIPARRTQQQEQHEAKIISPAAQTKIITQTSLSALQSRKASQRDVLYNPLRFAKGEKSEKFCVHKEIVSRKRASKWARISELA